MYDAGGPPLRAPRRAADTGDMPAISRPLMIVLGASVALLVLWLVALQPRPVSIDHTPLAPTQAIPKARQAVAEAAAANARAAAAGGGRTASPASAAAAAPAPGASKPAAQASAPTASKPVTQPAAAPKLAVQSTATTRGARRDAAIVRDVHRGKVVVLLFWNAESADDVATRGALRDLDLHRGKVVVRIVPIARVAEYASVTRGVTIAQSPTIVVIGHKGRARVIAGLSEPREISQAVGDALAGR